MKGDALASGQRSATFSVAPNLKFDEGVMRDDLTNLSQDEFIAKYMVTHLEWMRLYNGRNDEERVSSFAEEMKQRAEFAERELASDKKQEESLNRDCFLIPFTPEGISGRVIVSRDQPAKPQSKLALPKSLRKERTLLPTTGHVIKETLNLIDPEAVICDTLVGKRVLFSPMSGTAICFKGYPTWIQLELSEILAIVDKEDATIVEEELEPMV